MAAESTFPVLPPAPPRGCICPPGANRECQAPACPRQQLKPPSVPRVTTRDPKAYTLLREALKRLADIRARALPEDRRSLIDWVQSTAATALSDVQRLSSPPPRSST